MHTRTHTDTHKHLGKRSGIMADIFKCILLNENDKIMIPIPLKLVPGSQDNNKPALFQAMAWRRTGDKPLPETMLTQFTGSLCCIRGRWVS